MIAISAEQRRFEIAATVLWRSITDARDRAAERDALTRVAAAMHGIRLCAGDAVRDDAECLRALCWSRLEPCTPISGQQEAAA
jgi:hypothetical protein